MRSWRSVLRNPVMLGAVSALREQRYLLADTVLLGIVGALAAQLFVWMLHEAQALLLSGIAGYQAPAVAGEGGTLQQVIGVHGLWYIPIVTTLGGLISGFLVYTWAPEAEGHGTDTVVKAYHTAAGRIRARVPFLKMIASAVTIGSGGSAGREGPTALIAAGVGSIYAQLTHRSEDEQRLLIVMGMAAGLSAVFRSPIGTAIFAIEVLYSGMEFEASALFYTMLASVVAYAVNGLFVGYTPLFHVPTTLQPLQFADYSWYIVLGLVSGVLATLLPFAFYEARDLFLRLPLPPHIKPALGGLGVGLLALVFPQVLGGGYGWIQEAINGQLVASLLLVLIFAKLLAFTLTVSSGGSGGVFAPSLFVGAMLGGFLAQAFQQPPAAFVVVGMAAVFGGAARVPIATLLMVTEMTGGYTLLVPAALAVMLSYLIQVALSARLSYKSLYEAQVPGRADSPAHHIEQLEAAIHLLGTRGVVLPTTVSHLDLRTLVASGLPVDLPGGKRLAIGVLKAQSPFVGKPVRESFPFEGQNDLEVVAVFREGQTLLPHTSLRLQARDRLLVITTLARWESLAANFSPLPLPLQVKH